MAHDLESGRMQQPRRLSRRAFATGVLSVAAALSLRSISRPDSAMAAGASELSNFASGEVCLVVSASVGDPKALYEGVRSWANASITAQVRAASPVDPLDPRDRELNPGSLRPFLPQPDNGTSSVSWLVPQKRAPVSPWLILDPPVRKSVRQVLLFYSIGVGQPGVDDLAAIVRRMVNVVNGRLRIDAGSGSVEFHVDAATPNWYVVAASAHTCGGPAGRPEPAPAAEWRLRFRDPGLESRRVLAADAIARQGKSKVVVAVLDTSPEPTAVAAAASAFSANRLLKHVARSVSVGQAPSLAAANATPGGPSTPVLPEWYGAQRATGLSIENFRIEDHGLMASGIIRDLAPATDLRLIRVLGDYGVGTLQGLAAVLNQLPSTLNPDATRRVIVNLSLMVDIPASHKLVQRWFPGLSGPPDDAVLQAALDPLDESIRAPIDALSRQGVLVIAAAGNDALPVAFGVPTRPLPRFPARIESVLSVAAAKRDGTPASYSNLATVPPQSSFGPATTNGIAVLGGEAALHSGWWGPPPSPQNPPVPGLPALFGPRFLDLASVPGPPDAIVGIASAQRLALARVTNPTSGTLPPPNTTGWSYWTGTSFATPVATALAATLWELDPALPSSDILGMVRSFARAPATGLGCNLLEVQQT